MHERICVMPRLLFATEYAMGKSLSKTSSFMVVAVMLVICISSCLAAAFSALLWSWLPECCFNTAFLKSKKPSSSRVKAFTWASWRQMAKNKASTCTCHNIENQQITRLCESNIHNLHCWTSTIIIKLKKKGRCSKHILLWPEQVLNELHQFLDVVSLLLWWDVPHCDFLESDPRMVMLPWTHVIMSPLLIFDFLVNLLRFFGVISGPILASVFNTYLMAPLSSSWPFGICSIWCLGCLGAKTVCTPQIHWGENVYLSSSIRHSRIQYCLALFGSWCSCHITGRCRSSCRGKQYWFQCAYHSWADSELNHQRIQLPPFLRQQESRS